MILATRLLHWIICLIHWGAILLILVMSFIIMSEDIINYYNLIILYTCLLLIPPFIRYIVFGSIFLFPWAPIPKGFSKQYFRKRISCFIILVISGAFLVYYLTNKVEKQDSKNEIKQNKETNIIPSAKKVEFSKRWNDPGYVESEWSENTFVLAIKSPPNIQVYGKMVCKIALDEYNLKGFTVRITKLSTGVSQGQVNCD